MIYFLHKSKTVIDGRVPNWIRWDHHGDPALLLAEYDSDAEAVRANYPVNRWVEIDEKTAKSFIVRWAMES